MMRLLPALFALILPVSALAQYVYDGTHPAPGEMGNPVIGGPLGNNDPQDIVPVMPALPAMPLLPQDQDRLREVLVGKPVHGISSGRIGQVSDIVVGADQRVINVVIQIDAALDPGQANLAAPWIWIRSQWDAPTLVVPWTPGAVAWLTGSRRSEVAEVR